MIDLLRTQRTFFFPLIKIVLRPPFFFLKKNSDIMKSVSKFHYVESFMFRVKKSSSCVVVFENSKV